MGWQARINKNNETSDYKTCNKCHNTGVKKRFVSTDGISLEKPLEIKCKCILKAEAEARLKEEALKTLPAEN